MGKNKIMIKERTSSMKTINPIDEVESMYPNMTDKFKEIQREQYHTFCKKTLNYGPDAVKYGTELNTDDDIRLSLTGLWYRLFEKVQRLKQLVVLNQDDLVGESVDDTIEDLTVYGIIAKIVKSKSWGK